MSGPDVTWADVLDLVTRLDASGLADAEVTAGGVHIRVSRHALDDAGTAADAAPHEQAASEPLRSGLIDVIAPMYGVVYFRPSPKAEPFVRVGDVVEPDTTVAIIEVMKLMNNVTADVAGRVAEICATEGEIVDENAVLLRVEPT